jgi:hypothetical protein
VTQHDAYCGLQPETDCWCGGILSGKLRYIECWETRKCESVLCDYLTFCTNRQFWVFQLFRIKEPYQFWFGFLRGEKKKKAELENHWLHVFQKHQKTNSFHERTGKEPVVVRKKVSFFMKFLKKLRTKVLYRNQSFILFTLAR